MMFTCTKCNKNFSRKDHLDRHFNKKNPCDVKKNFICYRCGKVFFYNRDLIRHINRKIPCVNKILNIELELIRATTEAKLKIMEAAEKYRKIRNLVLCIFFNFF
jgi:uncharacterized C2H2 Zn-finger protein